MKLSMKDIIDKYSTADKFCLSLRRLNKVIVTEEEYDKALKNIRLETQKRLKHIYNNNPFKYDTSVDFLKVFSEIEEECRNCNKKRPSFIADEVGKTTKYGEGYWTFYFEIGLLIEREMDKKNWCRTRGKNPLKFVPKELKDYLIKYDVSFSNAVNISGELMINYYFILNNETKKYLLKYPTDFDLDDLEDLTIYKNNKICFSSCTHEEYNSLEDNYN